MPLFHYQDTLASAGTGRPVSNATVTVKQYPSNAEATIYDADTQVVASVKSNSIGRFGFYADAGRYNIFVNGNLSAEDVAIGAELVTLTTIALVDTGGSGKACEVAAHLDGQDIDGVDIWSLQGTTAA